VKPSYKKGPLPAGAKDYLDWNNERLQELRREYSNCDPMVTVPFRWVDEHVKADDLKYFRGDNAFVWQLRNHISEINYILTTYYVRTIDSLSLLDTLIEDGEFGVWTFLCAGKLVSRDLLDSIVQIYFLEKHLKISSLTNPNILDIGAGYGRLAHRMVEALPNLNNVFCADAVSVSTFLCEYYLRFRNVQEKTKVIPLNRIEDLLSNQPINLAINIHSFSECTIAAIEWWMKLLKKHSIRYIMIVPNALDHGGEQLLTNDRQDFLPIVEKQGYRLCAKEPKYRDASVQRYGIYPTYHYLFELQ
jgi:SAM-dependent methyltransferase